MTRGARVGLNGILETQRRSRAPGKVDFNRVTLDQAALRFLESKGEKTRRAYRNCLKRFTYFYPGGLAAYINLIEEQIRENEGRSIVERVRPGEDVARGFVRWHADNGYAPKATRQSMSALQNSLKYYGISMSWNFIELPNAQPLPQNAKHEWILEEMKQFIDAQDTLRDKAMVALIFQSGLSIGDAVALNYGDVRRELEAGKMPIMIHLYRQKTGVDFRTFIGRDAVKLLGEYLKPRIPLQDGDPLFTKLGTSKRVTITAFEMKLRRLAPRLPFLPDDDGVNGYTSVRPHSLRGAFRSRLTGKMADTLIEFMMGHEIGAEKRAYLNMPVEELRELYGNYEYLLKIEKTSKEEIEEKNPQPLPPEAVAKIHELEASTLNLLGENIKLKERVATLEKLYANIGTEEKRIAETRMVIIEELRKYGYVGRVIENPDGTRTVERA
jgi:integrase